MAADFTPPVDNALTTNSIGLPDDLIDGGPIRGSRRFPIWVERSSRGSVTSMRLGPIRIADFADLAIAQQHVFVFDVEHLSGTQDDDGTWHQRSLAAAATELGAHPISGDDENILLTNRGFQALAAELGHYQMSALSLEERATDLADVWARAAQAAEHGDCVLDAVKQATAYVNIHDDCYVYFETRNGEVAKALVARLIWIAAATAAREQNVAIPDSAPENDIVDACLGDDGLFYAAMERIEATEEVIRVPYSHSTFTIGTDQPSITHLLQHRSTSGWSVSRL